MASRPADPSLPCGDVLPTLVNVLGRYPADGKGEYAFQVEPFAPIVTFAKVGVLCSAAGSVIEGSTSHTAGQGGRL